MRDDLHAAVTEAFETLVAETGLDSDALFGDRVLGEFDGVSARTAYAAGIIEGAGIALGMTALELVDAVGAGEKR